MVVLRAKCLILGDQAVGKSALAQSFHSEGTEFPTEYAMTTGIEFYVKELQVGDTSDKVEFHLIDSAGAPEFREFAKQMWSEPSMVMLVFDVCAESSFNNLTLWLEQYQKRGLNPGRQVRGVVVGTKCDKSASRRVTAEAGETFAEQNNMQYFETSAKESDGVEQPFECLAQNFYNHYNEALEGMVAAAV